MDREHPDARRRGMEAPEERTPEPPQGRETAPSHGRGMEPPRGRGVELPRPRVMTMLSEIPDLPVTVVKAGAGYGKTTAVGAYVRQSGLRVQWLTVREGDRYGVRFVGRVLDATLPDEVPVAEAERVRHAAESPLLWTASARWAAELAAAYVHDDTLLVFDDFHLLDEEAALLQWFDAWLRDLPPHVHVVLLTRTRPTLPWVDALTLRGDVLWVREKELAFTADEVGFLFHGVVADDPGLPALERSQVDWLLRRTGGMALVLAMLLRDWRQHRSFERLQAALADRTPIPAQVLRLFTGPLTAEQRAFLQRASVFSPIDPDLCDAALGRRDSARLLAGLERRGHIAIAEGGQGYELHPLVRETLTAGLDPEERRGLVERAIRWYSDRGELDRALRYVFALEDEARIADLLLPHIPGHLERGRVSTVQDWLDRLSDATISASPGLLWARAEVARHANRYQEAQASFAAARSLAAARGDRKALAQVETGLARLYLDTIQPARAALHIREARAHVDREDVQGRIAIAQLAFENSINQGRLRRAERLLAALRQLEGASPPDNNSDARLLLRTGRLQETVAVLRPRADGDPADGRSALSHREATLLLALVHAMLGEADKAREQAERAHRVGHTLQSPFVSAVGFIRLGHAFHLQEPRSDAALHAYQEAVARMDEMQVPRGKSEALLGLCLSHGYRGQFALARMYAQESIEIASAAGDLWMASLVRVGFGQSAVMAGQFAQAVEALRRCRDDFGLCGDPFLRLVSQIWLALALYRAGDRAWGMALASALWDTGRLGAWFLWERPTFFGLRDVAAVVPMLQVFRQREIDPDGDSDTRHGTGRWVRAAVRILERTGCLDVEHHPGYTLRVRTLGGFSVWRGFSEIPHKEWQRDKARKLFQLLLTNRGTLLHREEICERLWPEADPETAERDFKVALHALSNVIDPGRPGRGPSVFLVRRGALYGLTEAAWLEVDRDVFLACLREAAGEPDEVRRREVLARALAVWQGEYLPEVRYEPWCDSERDRLRMLFVDACVTFARLCCGQQRFAEAIAACERATAVEPAWEEAYVWWMQAAAGLFNRPLVMQVYRTCERVLRQELGVAPMASTRAVYEALVCRWG
ncbi:BTAD domain-containing putative transcriptional regulator [Alicyclobacillus macrosporangiidus]|uniref:ATP-, maltotriose-and DNA-dependent transcriptional regulator MalT n=1 Tax=Alicyclobacillus macrosporangiidus TaxID=392015 RepID=A0A1I7H0N2_9BACL|nr:BTAD domain-containing putative transcriptional regulator [Alicyclobacillus macrosporangiidus]SFU54271.1 ATP-, maltotriose-and DNA-dependent transcriptional regulator MalT [Alicyclobacillus macrosporangiidus]